MPERLRYVDTDAVLTDLRAAAQEAEDDYNWAAAHRAIEIFNVLDRSLSNGGALPKAWAVRKVKRAK